MHYKRIINHRVWFRIKDISAFGRPELGGNAALMSEAILEMHQTVLVVKIGAQLEESPLHSWQGLTSLQLI